MSGRIDIGSAALLEFWTERHLCTLTTLRADGSPHVVAVGATLDPEHGLARVISSTGAPAIFSRMSPVREPSAEAARQVSTCLMTTVSPTNFLATSGNSVVGMVRTVVTVKAPPA